MIGCPRVNEVFGEAKVACEGKRFKGWLEKKSLGKMFFDCENIISCNIKRMIVQKTLLSSIPASHKLIDPFNSPTSLTKF